MSLNGRMWTETFGVSLLSSSRGSSVRLSTILASIDKMELFTLIKRSTPVALFDVLIGIRHVRVSRVLLGVGNFTKWRC